MVSEHLTKSCRATVSHVWMKLSHSFGCGLAFCLANKPAMRLQSKLALGVTRCSCTFHASFPMPHLRFESRSRGVGMGAVACVFACSPLQVCVCGCVCVRAWGRGVASIFAGRAGGRTFESNLTTVKMKSVVAASPAFHSAGPHHPRDRLRSFLRTCSHGPWSFKSARLCAS